MAAKLTRYADRPDTLVLGLPRGGVPVAYEVARALRAPLDVLIVRKLGVPGQEELAMGAFAMGGVLVLDAALMRRLGITDAQSDAVIREEEGELLRRARRYRGTRPLPDMRDRTVLLVDDGIATGATMRSAVMALRRQEARHIVVAVPVAAPDTLDALRVEVDEVVCLITPERFLAVGVWYEDFTPTTDDEVRHLLNGAMEEEAGGAEA